MPAPRLQCGRPGRAPPAELGRYHLTAVEAIPATASDVAGPRDLAYAKDGPWEG